jgi:hypothetical protein
MKREVILFTFDYDGDEYHESHDDDGGEDY